MQRIRPRHVETLDPDEPPTFEALAQQPIEQEAERHWRTFQPRLVRSLEAEGPTALQTAIRNAWHQMEYQQLLLQADGMPEALASTVYRELLFPPPEATPTQGLAPLTTF